MIYPCQEGLGALPSPGFVAREGKFIATITEAPEIRSPSSANGNPQALTLCQHPLFPASHQPFYRTRENMLTILLGLDSTPPLHYYFIFPVQYFTFQNEKK